MMDRAVKQDVMTDQYSWDQSTDYVICREKVEKEIKDVSPQKVNQLLGIDTRHPDWQGPSGSWLSHAYRMHQVFPDIFCLKTKILPFMAYKSIANSSGLTAEQRQQLREWAEGKQPTQRELRERIKEWQRDDVARRGFRLMTNNHWRFASSDGPDDNGFDGGISNSVVANLLHYFTDRGDVVVDPMAGSGRTARVVAEIPYFSPDWENIDATEYGGERTVLMSDIAPTSESIVQADARENIPFTNADFVLLDPPYWRIAKDKYEHGGDTLDEWLDGLSAVLLNAFHALKEGGFLALILDDYLRNKDPAPLALLGAEVARKAGFHPRYTIYNNYTNASATMNAIQAYRAKRNRLMVNGMKIINVFER